MTDETVQRWLRVLLPRWAQDSLGVSMLAGFAISYIHPLFRQSIDPMIKNYMDPTAINFWSATAVSLVVVLSSRAGAHFIGRSSTLARRITSQVRLVEEVMEITKLSRVDRVAIRRKITERLAANIDPNSDTSSTAETVTNAANDEIPGLMNNKNTPLG